jgi:hypothetical protein
MGAGLFGLLLALTDGRDGLFYGVEEETEHLANPTITPPAGDFVRNFVVDILRGSSCCSSSSMRLGLADRGRSLPSR